MDLAPRVAPGEAQAASRYPVRPFLAVAYERTRDFFDTIYPILAAAGLAALWRDRGPPASEEARPPRRTRGGGSSSVGSARTRCCWPAAPRVPDVFLHGHETLLVTPLVCLAAGEAVSRLARRSRAGWWAAAAVVAALALQGGHGQWRAIADQLGNAR